MRTQLINGIASPVCADWCAFKRVVEVPGVSGRVVDVKTGQPVVGASVIRHAVKKKAVVTDSDGGFSSQACRWSPILFPFSRRRLLGLIIVTGSVEFVASGYEGGLLRTVLRSLTLSQLIWRLSSCDVSESTWSNQTSI